MKLDTNAQTRFSDSEVAVKGSAQQQKKKKPCVVGKGKDIGPETDTV